jgi:hypothetical protein
MPQRTPLQAYQDVLQAVIDGRVNPARMAGACQYRLEADGKPTINCGVGSLFSEAQLDNIVEIGMNHHEVCDLAAEIGLANVYEVTGLSIDQLAELQEEHDSAAYGSAGRFTTYLKKQIAYHEKIQGEIAW